MSYAEKLTQLVELIRSDTKESAAVIEVLRSGSPGEIQEMLMSLGDEGSERFGFSGLSPWTREEIEAAAADVRRIKPEDRRLSYWAW